MNIYLAIIPYVLILVVNELALFHTYVHLPAFTALFALHLVILYLINHKLTLPLKMFESGQKMIEPAEYYRHSAMSWLLAILVAILLIPVIMIFSVKRSDLFSLSLYIVVYGMLAYVMNVIFEQRERRQTADWDNHLVSLTVAIPVMLVSLWFQSVLLISAVKEQSLFITLSGIVKFSEITTFFPVFFGMRIVIWIFITLFSAAIMIQYSSTDELKWESHLLKPLIFHFAVGGVLIVWLGNMVGFLSISSITGWGSILLSATLLLLLAEICLVLLSLTTGVHFRSTDIEINYQDQKKHSLIYVVIWLGISFIMMNLSF